MTSSSDVSIIKQLLIEYCMDVEKLITKALLENALTHGSTRADAAMGPVMRECPEYRSKQKEVLKLAKPIAERINQQSEQDWKQELERLGGSGAPVKEHQDPFELEHPAPVLRFEPSVSGPMHIGHAVPLGLNHLLAARNDGKLILRIADTNPDNIYEPAYELLVKDAKWFTHENISEVIIQSDRMELYYAYAERMLKEGWAYVCTCEPETFRKLIHDKQGCPCRSKPPAIHLERWEFMRTEWKPGDAVVRVKTDIEHKNPAIRDWPALRINTSEHPRQKNKYRVWPLMNFSVSVDDIELGMTHVLRAKDHADNAKRQEYMYGYFDKPVPVVYNIGKINFTDLKLSTSKTRKRIDEGEFTGWDDIRLPFLPALRKRGFQNEALLRMAEEMGLSAKDKKLSKEEYFTNLEAFNREIIDPIAERAFFVEDPQIIEIKGAPIMEVEKDLHPDNKKGGRKLTVGPKVAVDPTDLQQPEGILFRLMDAYNFRYEEGAWTYVSKDLEDYQQAEKRRIIHYLPAEHDSYELTIKMPDGNLKQGIAEQHVRTYTQGALLQLERVGFVCVEDASKHECWYAHQ